MRIQQELDDLFSMFHDFEVVKFSVADERVEMTIVIPWGEIWNDPFYKIHLTLTGCHNLSCVYQVFDEPGENSNSLQKSHEGTTSNSKVIERIGLHVQRHIFLIPATYTLYCNCMNNEFAGAELSFSAQGYELKDQDGEELGLDKMKDWATQWWNKIQEMWNEQKGER